MTVIEKVLDEALKLATAEKARIIEQLIKSLDQPDEEIDKLWRKESESRIDAFERRDIRSVTVEEAFSKWFYRKPCG
jgi:putative addiction module component (TIGR02574 family)